MNKEYTRPKYKTGDIVIIKDIEEQNQLIYFKQVRIIKAYGIKEQDPNHEDQTTLWLYITEEILGQPSKDELYEPIEENYILEKLPNV